MGSYFRQVFVVLKRQVAACHAASQPSHAGQVAFTLARQPSRHQGKAIGLA